MIVHNVRERLFGELSGWLLEVDAGVYVGSASARTREALWRRAGTLRGEGSVLQCWPDSTHPQGLRYRSLGKPNRPTVDICGLTLTARRTAASQ